MKKTLLLITGLILAMILVACGGNDNNNNNTENNDGTDNNTEETNNNDTDNNNDATNNDANNNNDTTASAEEVYKNNCASCHGDDLEGEGDAPGLEAVGSDMSEDEIREQIEDGGDGMPGGLIEGEEADQVAQWLSDKK